VISRRVSISSSVRLKTAPSAEAHASDQARDTG
jgi:hypothetical protein